MANYVSILLFQLLMYAMLKGFFGKRSRLIFQTNTNVFNVEVVAMSGDRDQKTLQSLNVYILV